MTILHKSTERWVVLAVEHDMALWTSRSDGSGCKCTSASALLGSVSSDAYGTSAEDAAWMHRFQPGLSRDGGGNSKRLQV